MIEFIGSTSQLALMEFSDLDKSLANAALSKNAHDLMQLSDRGDVHLMMHFEQPLKKTCFLGGQAQVCPAVSFLRILRETDLGVVIRGGPI